VNVDLASEMQRLAFAVSKLLPTATSRPGSENSRKNQSRSGH
jgi:hypothetical protein